MAEWAWPAIAERTCEAEVHAFERSLEQIAAWRPDITFQNADPRMPVTYREPGDRVTVTLE